MYRNIADLEAIIAYAERAEVTSASVVGGGVCLLIDVGFPIYEDVNVHL